MIEDKNFSVPSIKVSNKLSIDSLQTKEKKELKMNKVKISSWF